MFTQSKEERKKVEQALESMCYPCSKVCCQLLYSCSITSAVGGFEAIDDVLQFFSLWLTLCLHVFAQFLSGCPFVCPQYGTVELCMLYAKVLISWQ